MRYPALSCFLIDYLVFDAQMLNNPDTKTYYGNAIKYSVIFEANKPMLTEPDKIYPGQEELRIPALD